MTIHTGLTNELIEKCHYILKNEDQWNDEEHEAQLEKIVEFHPDIHLIHTVETVLMMIEDCDGINEIEAHLEEVEAESKAKFARMKARYERLQRIAAQKETLSIAEQQFIDHILTV